MIKILWHIPCRILLLNIDICSIKVLSLLIIDVDIKLVYLIQKHQIYSLRIIYNALKNGCLDHLLAWVDHILLCHIVLAHFSLIVVLVSLVKKHRVDKTWISQGCSQVLKECQCCDSEETDREQKPTPLLEKERPVIVYQRDHERDVQ